MFYSVKIVGICNISLPLLDFEEKKIYIEYLCGSDYGKSGTILIEIVKQLFCIGDFNKILLTSYKKSVGYYTEKHFFVETKNPFGNSTMTLEKNPFGNSTMTSENSTTTSEETTSEKKK